MRRVLVVLLALAAATVVAVAVAQTPGGTTAPQADSPTTGPAAPGPQAPLPAPGIALPRTAAGLSAALTTTTRRLRAALGRWDPHTAPPQDVTLLALHHQRILRLLAARRALGDATLARLPRDVRGEARDTVVARRRLDTIPRAPGRAPPVRVAAAAPAAELRRAYAAAERRFGVPWSVLAAVNFVESAFGRVRSASEAGARGPMQFLPSTWRAYGMGGDIDDPHDAILAAANYLHASGAPRDVARALFNYNHSRAYVGAVRRFARRMAADERAFLTYYAWQVYARRGGTVRRLTGPGR